MSEHADVEALSAFVDGEAPEWAGHVSSCAACRASADELRAVAAAVGAPVEPTAAADRERALAAALGDIDRPAVVEDPRFARRRPRRSWNPAAVASVAAVLLVGILGVSVLVGLNGGSSSDETTTASRAPESVTRDLAGGAADSAAPAVPPTDLGDVPDAATLVARARVTGGTTAGATVSEGAASGGSGGAARSSANSGAAATPPQPAAGANATGGSALGSAGPSVVAPRPCEEQARSREPALGQVVYYATARQGTTPAVVLGFSTGPVPSPVTLLMLAQEGCAELLRAASP